MSARRQRRLTQFATPRRETIAELVEQHQIPVEKTVKTLIVKASEESGHSLVALLLRGDHELNEIKAEHLDIVAAPLEMGSEEEIRAIGAGFGSRSGRSDHPGDC